MSWAGSEKLGRLLVAAVLALPCASNADILYAASVRSGTAGTDGAVSGSLYTVNLGSGAATFVAPLRIDGASPIGITGLSAHPQTGVLYGITSQLSPTHPQTSWQSRRRRAGLRSMARLAGLWPSWPITKHITSARSLISESGSATAKASDRSRKSNG